MRYDEFISNVRDVAGLDSREEAERAARAALKTLGRRLTKGEADDLGAQLPGELGQHLAATTEEGESFSLDEFFEAVQVETGLEDRAEAERRARAVIGVMSETVTGGEMEDVFSQLPKDFGDLFSPKTV